MVKLPEFRAYRNLHKKCFSIQQRDPSTGRFKLHSHCDNFITNNNVFKVSQYGRKNVIKNKQKNVHAFVYFTDFNIFVEEFNTDKWIEITYDPYTMDSFMIKNSNSQLHFAKCVIFKNNKCYVKN